MDLFALHANSSLFPNLEGYAGIMLTTEESVVIRISTRGLARRYWTYLPLAAAAIVSAFIFYDLLTFLLPVIVVDSAPSRPWWALPGAVVSGGIGAWAAAWLENKEVILARLDHALQAHGLRDIELNFRGTTFDARLLDEKNGVGGRRVHGMVDRIAERHAQPATRTFLVLITG